MKREPSCSGEQYRLPKGFRKSLVLFNLHRAAATGTPDVIIVEGCFDTFALHQAGYPAVVALMGSTLVPYQADLLRAHFDHACLMLDGDFAGRHGTATIAPTLGARMPLTVIALEDGCQPDHLTPAAIRRLLRHSVGAPPSRQSRSPRRQESSHPCDHDDPAGIGPGGQPDTQTPDADRLESRR